MCGKRLEKSDHLSQFLNAFNIRYIFLIPIWNNRLAEFYEENCFYKKLLLLLLIVNHNNLSY